MRDLKTEYRRIFITSDYHIGHKNILGICNRQFPNIQAHDNGIVSNSNSVVTNEDLLINLGDVGFRCSAFHVANTLRELTCKSMLIFLGNHDKPLTQAIQRGLLDDLLLSGKIQIAGGMEAVNDRDLAISKMVMVDKQRIFLSHYSYRTWPSAFRDTWHLFGHSHSNLSPYFKSFDVGVDTNNFFPYDWETITEKMNQITTDFKEG